MTCEVIICILYSLLNCVFLVRIYQFFSIIVFVHFGLVCGGAQRQYMFNALTIPDKQTSHQFKTGKYKKNSGKSAE